MQINHFSLAMYKYSQTHSFCNKYNFTIIITICMQIVGVNTYFSQLLLKLMAKGIFFGRCGIVGHSRCIHFIKKSIRTQWTENYKICYSNLIMLVTQTIHRYGFNRSPISGSLLILSPHAQSSLTIRLAISYPTAALSSVTQTRPQRSYVSLVHFLDRLYAFPGCRFANRLMILIACRKYKILLPMLPHCFWLHCGLLLLVTPQLAVHQHINNWAGLGISLTALS
eukprot:TRINITY_DN5373_c0_g1_i5.p1 TRINITY_DN5373_c0_g1~~TRINITY_DN5373_c0_g1_i5.p1  ORF type:complete len:225 (+),score=-12.91 TRINITY_DN5373_c0_g1_i5:1478-2152(+)